MFTMIGLIIAGVLGAVTGAVGMAEQAKANKQQQQFASEEAEKSYQRSKPIQQVSDLVEAGLTEQQARQVVAGNGTPAAYTAAPAVNQMQGVDPTAVSAPIGQMFQQLGQLGQSSLESPNGGFFGAYAIEDVSKIITEHLGELPLAASTSISGFLRYLASDQCPEWAKSEDFQKAWNKAVGSTVGIRALQDYFNTSTNLEIGNKRAEAAVLDIASKELANQFSQIQIDDATVNYLRNSLQWIYDKDLIPQTSKTQLEISRKQFEEASRDLEFLTNKEYRNAYLMNMLKTQTNQVLMAQIAESMLTQQQDYLSDPNNAMFHGILQLFEQSGITRTELGSILATAEASGIPLISSLSGLIKDLVPDSGTVVSTIEEVSDKVVKAVAETAEAAQQAAGEIKDQSYLFGSLTLNLLENGARFGYNAATDVVNASTYLPRLAIGKPAYKKKKYKRDLTDYIQERIEDRKKQKS